MPFSPRDALFYLLERGLLEREDLLDGDTAVWDVSRRNRNLKVRLGDGRGFFLKQLASSDPRAAESILREASVFWLARNDLDFEVLRSVAPPCVGYDAHRGILVFELMAGSSAWERALGSGPDPRVASSLGRALGRVHLEAGRRMCESDAPAPFPRSPPWVLSLHRLPLPDGPGGESMAGTSPGMLELARLIRSLPEIGRVLDEARESWRRDGFIHGDLKWDNVLLPDPDAAGPVPAERGANRPARAESDAVLPPDGLRIADWELADIGDTAWDVASVLQSYWNQPLLEFPRPGAPAPPWVRWRSVRREALRAAAAAFWRAYAEARGLSGPDAARFLTRAVRLGAARTVLTAYEHLHGQSSLTSHSFALLREAVGVFDDPAPTVEALATA